MIDYKPIEIKEENEKNIFVIFGDKGSGKTNTAMSFPGNIHLFSFDGKAQRIKKYMHQNADRVTIWNGVPYVSYKKEEYTRSCSINFDYLLACIEHIRKSNTLPDWIVLDELGTLSKIIEMRMRFQNNIKPFSGIAERALWNYRNLDTRELLYSCLEVSNKGVIITTYSEMDEEIIDGTVIRKTKIPRWFDAIEKESDVIIKTYINLNEDRTEKFRVLVYTSKIPEFKTGIDVDVTGKNVYEELIKHSAQIVKSNKSGGGWRC